MDARERDLVTINTYDILGALGWRAPELPRRWLELLVRYPARRFAEVVLAFDETVRDAGLRTAAQGLLPTFANGLTVNGAERIPPRGPVLFLSNHPGMTDTLSLFAAVPRPDLRIIAADRAFLRALSAAARHLIFIPEGPDPAAVTGRAAAVRAAVTHLRAGGALLSFPPGRSSRTRRCFRAPCGRSSGGRAAPASSYGMRPAVWWYPWSSAAFSRAVRSDTCLPGFGGRARTGSGWVRCSR